MYKAWISIGFGLLCACAPDLSAGPGQRCDEATACGEALECYRGFCVPERSLPPEVGVQESEADSAILEDRPDAGPRPPAPAMPGSSPAAVQDASTAAGRGTILDAGILDAGDKRTAASLPAVTPAPATSAPPARTPPASSGAGSPAPPAKPPAAKDAGVVAGNADAGKPIALPDAAVARKCTLEQCCAEAARARARQDSEDRDDNRGQGGGKRCGCEDPQLLRALACLFVLPVSARPQDSSP